MSQQSQRIPWRWDADSRKYYYFDAQTDELVFEDGGRVRRPERIPRTAFNSLSSTTSAGATDHRSNPTAHSTNYVLQQSDRAPQSLQSLPRSMPQASGSGQRANPTSTPTGNTQASNAARDFASLTLQPSQVQSTGRTVPEPSSRVTTIRGHGIVDATDNDTGVRSLVQKAPLDSITDRRLATAGVFAESALLGTDGDIERLYESYRKRSNPRKFFVKGRVFFVLWAEPAGESTTQATGAEAGVRPGRYGESVFSKVRRFVVILEGLDYCTCLPIATYGGQGVGKRGVTKWEHSIIHTTRQAPPPLSSERAQRGEETMQPNPIRVDADDPSDKLTELSRLDYGKFHTVHHNLKVRNFGKINPNSMDDFTQQWNIVLQRRAATGAQLQNPPTVLHSIQEHGAPRQRRESDASRPTQSYGVRQRPAATRPSGNQRSGNSRRSERDSGSSSSDSDESESAVGNAGPAQRGTSSSVQSIQSSTLAAAVDRLIARGYTRAQATQAVEDQARRRRDSGQRDDASDSQSDGSREGPARAQRSGRNQGSSDRAQTTARRQQAGNNRSTDVVASGSRPQARRTSQQATGSSQTRAPTRAVGGATTSYPERTAPASVPTGPTAAERAEAAIRNLMTQGYTRSKAIAYLQQRAAGGNSR